MKNKWIVFHIILAPLCFASLERIAYANLRVYPTRVVIEGNKKTASLKIRQESSSSMTYKLSLKKYKIDDWGNAVEEEQSPEESRQLNRLVRFSPRLIKLNQGEEQTVRVLARTGAIDSGETRVYLHFSTFEDKDAQIVASPDSKSDIKTTLKAHFAVAIPIIIRKGKLVSEFTITEALFSPFKNDASTVKLTLKKVGNKSIYGDAELIDLASNKPLGLLKGISIFNEQRVVNIPVSGLIDPANKSVKLVFTDSESKLQKEKLLEFTK